MCVTNTTSRRAKAISLPNLQQNASSSSKDLSKRLVEAFSSRVAAPTIPCVPPKPTVTKKRRRKPQQPGFTAKHNQRHFVVHNYRDHANDSEVGEAASHPMRKGGVAVAFPLKLHSVLDQVMEDGLGHVISWQPHGRCFVIHKPKVFVAEVMPKYFRQTKLTSFQRQLNLYGFCRITRGADAGGYYHELFLRGKVFLCNRLVRTKVKGTKIKAASSPDQEPNFYSMPFVSSGNTIVTSSSGTDDSDSDHLSTDDSLQSYGPTTKVQPTVAPVSGSLVQMQPPGYVFQLPNPVYSNQESSIGQPLCTFQQPALRPAPPPVYAKAPPMSAPQKAEEGDHVLDAALDDIFFNEAMVDDLQDFVHDWDPNDASPMLDESQISLLLDRINT